MKPEAIKGAFQNRKTGQFFIVVNEFSLVHVVLTLISANKAYIYSLWFKTKFHNDNLKKAVEIKADIPAKIELWGIGTAVWKYSLNTVKTQLSQNILSCKLN